MDRYASYGDIPPMVRRVGESTHKAYAEVRKWLEGFLDDDGSLSSVPPKQPVLELSTQNDSCAWKDGNGVVYGKPFTARMQVLANGEVLCGEKDKDDTDRYVLLGAVEGGMDIPRLFERQYYGSMEQLTPWLSEGKRPVLYSYDGGFWVSNSPFSVFQPIQTITYVGPGETLPLASESPQK